ncbi:hypothetical protein NEMBOFW57_000406 [Staphylotrichum longicolle]|uniref:Uncharacterized protein n=1 Tax=Staphylotrichum longicolle TaxID=669026 RepID=A0AAD4EZQ2_9PEZI|nr:hypothetical protein NEMBOFW57_000406 [Staphylotrichum longicolle]
MMETAVNQAAAASRPISLIADPATWDDALTNQAAFSDKARQVQPPSAQQVPGPGPEPGTRLRQLTTVPHVKKCYGWLTLAGYVLKKLNPKLRAPVLTIDKVTRSIAADKKYMAVVYEYVEEGEPDPELMQEALDFFWLAGFSGTYSPLLKNWVSGVLVDLCDIIPPRGYGWKPKLYRDGPGSAHLIVKRGMVAAGDPAKAGLRPPPPPPVSVLDRRHSQQPDAHVAGPPPLPPPPS